MFTHKSHHAWLRRFSGISLVFAAALLLAACGGDKSEVTSGGGGSGVESDGGNPSARFAGTYVGTITTNLEGSSIDDQSDTDDLIMIVRSNGTATLTIDDETVEGDVSGNRFGFSIRIIEERGLIECKGDAVISGTFQGGGLSGTTNGSGSCKLTAASTGLTITGTLSATKQ